MISKRLFLFENDFFGIRISDIRIVFANPIPCDDAVHVFHRRRIVHKELAVVFEIGMKRKPDQPFFITFAGNTIADIKEDFCGRSLHIVLKNVNDSILFHHKNAIVTSVSQMDRAIEPQFRKRVLKPDAGFGLSLPVIGLSGNSCIETETQAPH